MYLALNGRTGSFELKRTRKPAVSGGREGWWLKDWLSKRRGPLIGSDRKRLEISVVFNAFDVLP